MIWTSIRRLADSIINDIRSGLRGYHNNMSISEEQLEEEIVKTRLLILKEQMTKGLIPIQDLLLSINCIPVDCDSLSKCPCNKGNCGNDPVAHFQIPQILFDFGLKKSIYYIGSVNKTNSFIVYTKPINIISNIQKYRKRGRNKSWVYIDVTPNKNGLLDCYIFNAPFLKQVSVTAIFKDLRQLEGFQCDCSNEQADKSTQMDNNLNYIDQLVKDKLVKEKLYFYKQFSAPLLPNDQRLAAG